MHPQGKGIKCPADVIGNAVKVMRILTGEEQHKPEGHRVALEELGRSP
jgi:hypothetical protein